MTIPHSTLKLNAILVAFLALPPTSAMAQSACKTNDATPTCPSNSEAKETHSGSKNNGANGVSTMDLGSDRVIGNAVSGGDLGSGRVKAGSGKN